LLTSEQCRAARALLNWSQADLASASQVSLSTVGNFEAGRSTPVTNNLIALKRAMEAAGVEFIPENGGGEGVRLREPRRGV
jgi:transcriptional regulator with XRE-family HTH domain